MYDELRPIPRPRRVVRRVGTVPACRGCRAYGVELDDRRMCASCASDDTRTDDPAGLRLVVGNLRPAS